MLYVQRREQYASQQRMLQPAVHSDHHCLLRVACLPPRQPTSPAAAAAAAVCCCCSCVQDAAKKRGLLCREAFHVRRVMLAACALLC